MEFFGIGAWELLMIGLIALIVLGPRQMIIMARKAGEWTRKLQLMWQEASQTINQEIQAIEAEGEELKGLGADIQQIGRDLRQGLKVTLPPADAGHNQIGQPPKTPPHPASTWSSSAAPAAPPGNGSATRPNGDAASQPAGAEPSTTQPAIPEPSAPAKYSAWSSKPPAQ